MHRRVFQLFTTQNCFQYGGLVTGYIGDVVSFEEDLLLNDLLLHINVSSVENGDCINVDVDVITSEILSDEVEITNLLASGR